MTIPENPNVYEKDHFDPGACIRQTVANALAIGAVDSIAKLTSADFYGNNRNFEQFLDLPVAVNVNVKPALGPQIVMARQIGQQSLKYLSQIHANSDISPLQYELLARQQNVVGELLDAPEINAAVIPFTEVELLLPFLTHKKSGYFKDWTREVQNGSELSQLVAIPARNQHDWYLVGYDGENKQIRYALLQKFMPTASRHILREKLTEYYELAAVQKALDQATENLHTHEVALPAGISSALIELAVDSQLSVEKITRFLRFLYQSSISRAVVIDTLNRWRNTLDQSLSESLTVDQALTHRIVCAGQSDQDKQMYHTLQKLMRLDPIQDKWKARRDDELVSDTLAWELMVNGLRNEPVASMYADEKLTYYVPALLYDKFFVDVAQTVGLRGADSILLLKENFPDDALDMVDLYAKIVEKRCWKGNENHFNRIFTEIAKTCLQGEDLSFNTVREIVKESLKRYLEPKWATGKNTPYEIQPRLYEFFILGVYKEIQATVGENQTGVRSKIDQEFREYRIRYQKLQSRISPLRIRNKQLHVLLGQLEVPFSNLENIASQIENTADRQYFWNITIPLIYCLRTQNIDPTNQAFHALAAELFFGTVFDSVFKLTDDSGNSLFWQALTPRSVTDGTQTTYS